jgi:nucleotide-binding universal stress UspA family protein
MLRRILVSTDFSHEAARAVDRAALLASQHRATVDVLHARRALRSLAGRTEHQLRVELEALRRRHVLAAGHLRRGGLIPAIEETAALLDSDLLVLGDGRRRRLRDAVIGSTATRVVSRVARDVLVVRARGGAHYREPLVCLDDTADAPRVLAAAAALCPAARLRILHAYDVPYESKLRFADRADGAIRAHRRIHRAEVARAISRRIRESAVSNERVDVTLRRGHPARVIPAAAARLRSDLVVVGHNIHSALAELVLGSLSKAVLGAVACDVAVIRRFE